MDTKKSGELQVTQKNLDETRAELKSDITSVREEMKSGFASLRSEISTVDSKITTVDSKVVALDAKLDAVISEISGFKSEVSTLTAAVHRTLSMVEEQSTQNKYVLDGHQSLHDRQDRFEKEIREDVSQIKTAITRIDTTN